MSIEKKSGFTLVEVMIVVIIIGLLAAIVIPSFVKARTRSFENVCLNNLRQISGAKEIWILDEGVLTTEPPMSALVNLYMKRDPNCPVNGTYTVNDAMSDPACGSYSSANHDATL